MAYGGGSAGDWIRWMCLIALGAAACAPTAPAGSVAERSAGEQARAPSRTLVIAARNEPPSLAAKGLQPVAGAADRVVPLFNATLDLVDERAVARPYLAEGLPQLNTESWQVFADGRMQTSYRLRAGLQWHDGAALSGDDFVFAWRVYSSPELGTAASPPISQMEEVSSPDPRTVVIRWRNLYPDAGRLDRGFQPLPRHLLADDFRRLDAHGFAQQPFWTLEYVGLGPYRLERWEPGAFMVGAGFAGHALGPPRIDRVRVTFIADSNAVLAALLSGEAHYSLEVAISQEEGSVLEREWAARGGGSVLFSPTAARILQIQHRPDIANPRELLDVRVRRTLAHAIDRDELNEVLQGGRAIKTLSVTSPLSDYYPMVDAALSKYPYDLRRGQELLEEAGLRRGTDGFYATAAGQPFRPEVLHLSGPANERENTLLVEAFRRAGIQAVPATLPVAQLRDVEARALAPAILPPHPTDGERFLRNYSSASIPSSSNRWQGVNYGGWSNPEFDRQWEAFNNRLERAERVQGIVQMERVFSQEVAGIPYYYNPTVNAHVADLLGPTARTVPEAGLSLARVFQWEWR